MPMRQVFVTDRDRDAEMGVLPAQATVNLNQASINADIPVVSSTLR